MTHFEGLRDAANTLGVSLVAPAVIELPNGTVVTGEVLVEGFGARRGTIIVADTGSLRTVMPELRSAGYTVSSFRPSSSPISRQDMKAMLADWTWQGDGFPPFADGAFVDGRNTLEPPERRRSASHHSRSF